MLSKFVNLNCENYEEFLIEFEENNKYGISTDQDLITRWLSDLRSGKYQQVYGKLFDTKHDNCYCTLGVLFKKRIKKLRQRYQDGKPLTDVAILHEVIEQDDTFLKNIFVYTKENHKYNLFDFIIELNDNSRLSFGYIADMLEIIHCTIRGEITDNIQEKILKQNKWTMVHEQ